ncbi:MAG: PSD1 domain-containing protein [Pirellulaceae bacterium]|nr:PSD1 domain-containing protein [Pirellulaceae bacterium]
MLVFAKMAEATLSGVQAGEFEDSVEPILRGKCFECHAGEDPQGGLRLDRLASLLSGGDSGEPAVVPGKPNDSYLIKMIIGGVADRSMPPDDPLSADEISVMRQWIAAGAPTPDSYGPPEEQAELKHWSFQPLSRSTSHNSIDAFIHQKLDEHSLSESPVADRRTLIRRLYLVMHGLPPTPEQVDQFALDPAPDAWQQLVDRVLESPRFGEAFATLWLDLVRFSETDGFETNRERPTAWHYRDWVIRAFNEDMPYDQFIRQQIAGDQLDQPLGTGFLVAGPHDIVKGQDAKLGLVQRMNELDDMIGATGTTFLGMTLACARCHNHKFDPISQRDYYALQAIFAGVHHGQAPVQPTAQQQQQLDNLDLTIRQLEEQLREFKTNNLREPVTASLNVELFPSRLARRVRMTIHGTNTGQPCIDELEIFSGQQNVALASRGAVASSSGDFEHPFHQLAHINDGLYGNQHSWIASQESGAWLQIEFPEPVEIDRIQWARDRNQQYQDRVAIDYEFESALAAGQWQPLTSSTDRQPFGESSEDRYDLSGASRQQARDGRAALRNLKQARKERQKLIDTCVAWTGTFQQPAATFRLYRGEPEQPREQVAPGGPAALAEFQLPTDSAEAGRRLALADWLADPNNPLTPRVIVNRIWQFHFGTGIVETASDFGHNGAAASHPELLDWLAQSLIASGWSLKSVHRHILLSQTWQQSSLPQAAAVSKDAGSRLLWRFPPRRLQAEAIRDCILAASGKLDVQSAGGPGFSAFDVDMENVRHYHPRKQFGPDQWRRMIYMTRVRQEKDDLFGSFDCPDGGMSVAKRGHSTTPLQALALLNHPFMSQQSEFLAERLAQSSSQLDRQIELAWQWCYQRPPTPDELAEAGRFIAQHGLQQFARALLCTNEFLFIL